MKARCGAVIAAVLRSRSPAISACICSRIAAAYATRGRDRIYAKRLRNLIVVYAIVLY